MLNLTNTLINQLNTAGVRYCHWKSNIHLAEGLSGETDLDFLVRRDQAGVFTEIVNNLGFKLLRSEGWKNFPSVVDFLGLDAESGKILHLHVYYKLILGKSMRKEYHIPCEDILLEGNQQLYGVRIPFPEAELLIHIIRMAVKRKLFSIHSAAKHILRRSKQSDVLYELQWLVKRSDLSKFSRLIEKFGLKASDCEALFSIVRDPSNVSPNLLKKVKRSMTQYRRFKIFEGTLLWINRTVLSMLAHMRHNIRKQIVSGGATIAIVGPDGAGKTTVCDVLIKRLGWKLWVKKFYLGSNQPTLHSRFVRFLVIPMLVPWRLLPRVRLARLLKYLAQGIIEISYASDRLSRLRKGFRLASNGCIVIFDRFPIVNVADQPFLWEEKDELENHYLIRCITKKLKNLYSKIPKPDVLIHLSLPAELALARKPNSNPDLISAKEARLHSFSSKEGFERNLLRIDASCSLDIVISQVMGNIWRRL